MLDFFVKAIEKVIEVPIDEAVGYLFCTICGVIVSWFYKCRSGNFKLSAYWLEDMRSSLSVIGAAMAGFLITIISEPGVGKITYLALGMAADSMLNKPPLPSAVKVALDKIEAVQNATDPASPPNTTPSCLCPNDEQSAACALAVEQVGQNYIGSNPTGKTDSTSGNG